MTRDENLNDHDDVPDVALDHLTVGFSGKLNNSPDFTLRTLADLAKASGFETTPNSRRGAAGYHQFSIPLTSEDGRTLGNVTIELHVRLEAAGRMVTTDRSAMSLNPQRIMRQDIAYEPEHGERCLDGNDNTLPSDMQGAAALPQQLALLEEALTLVVMPFLNDLTDPFPWTFSEIWLKRAEAFVDTRVDDAVEAARIAQHTALRGTQDVHRRAYERGASDAQGVPVVHYRETKSSPILKVYAKHARALRHEVVCKDRSHIVQLTGPVKGPCTGAGMRELALGFAHRAAPLVSRLRTHVAEALSGRAMGVDLILALDGLIELATGGRAGRRGPPLNDETVRTSRHLLGQLLSAGFCDATGLPPRHAQIRLLTRWAEARHAVTKHPSRQIYYLEPRFGRAVRELAPG